MEKFKFLSTSTIQRGTTEKDFQEDCPPAFPCPPTCKSINHKFHCLDISLLYSHYHRQQPSEVPSSPPPSPPLKPPKSPHSNSLSPYLVKKPFIPHALFLCQGIVSLGPPPNPSRTTMVVIAHKDEEKPRLEDLQYRGMPLYPIHDKTLEVVINAVQESRAFGVLIADRPSFVPEEAENKEKIAEVVVHVKNFHKKYNNLIDQVWDSISKVYPLLPNHIKTDLPQVPEIKRNLTLPSVAMKLFDGISVESLDSTSSSSSSPSACPFVTILSIKKTDEEEEQNQNITELMTAVMESLKKPEKVSFRNDDTGIELTASSYMRAYRRLSRLIKKKAAELEHVDGQSVAL